MNYIDTIRKACIAVNPSILDLKMGCEVNTTKLNRYTIKEPLHIIWNTVYSYCIMWEENHGTITEILWRPLHLEDILMVLGQDYWFIHWKLFYLPAYNEAHEVEYTLYKSLQDQSEETLKFICDNIK